MQRETTARLIGTKGTSAMVRDRNHVEPGLDDASPAGSDGGGREGGFILVMLGLMIIPLMVFAALAVDVASYYSRTTQLQKAADAAALAAVPWMPNTGRADQVAIATMARNGFVDGVDDIEITYLPGSAGPNSYRVVAKDTKAQSFFKNAFTGHDVQLDRGATATVDPPLQLGSPLNYFGGEKRDYPGNAASSTTRNPGTGEPPSNRTCYEYVGRSSGRDYGYRWNSNGSRDYIWFNSGWWNSECVWTIPEVLPQIRSDMSPGFWAAVEAPYTDAVQGDRYSPRCYGKGGTSCISDNRANPEHRDRGYLYTLKMPASPPSKVVVQVFDASFTNRGQSDGTGDNRFQSNDNWYTNFTMYNADTTPYDPTNNPAMTRAQCGGSANGNVQNSGGWALQSEQNQEFKDTWMTLCTISSPQPGAVYVIEVGTSGTGGNASNNYALRAIGTSDASMPIPQDAANYPVNAVAQSQQPNLAAFSNMAMYNNLSSGTANFYLAKVPEQYAGRTLDIELYDPGEGTGVTVTINTPKGVQKGCTYQSNRLVNIGGGGSGGGGTIASEVPLTQISSSQDCAFPTAGRFNGNVVLIKVPLPVNYTCDETISATWWSSSPTNAGCWWSVSFQSNGAHDNTTWSASIEGDPVRLTE